MQVSQVRWFYSKGAFLVLLWTTLVSAAVRSYWTILGERILLNGIELGGINSSRVFIALPFLVYITIPLLGWLADAKLGNYRVFKFSCFFLLIALTIMCINIILNHMLNSIVLQYASVVIAVLACLASAAVCFMTALSNARCFIHQYFKFHQLVCVFTRSWVLDYWVAIKYTLVLHELFDNQLFTKMQLFSLFPVTCLVIICSTMFLLAPKWLIIEPKSPKALKTIYQVLKFAVKHKAPIYRSALTYWEEDVPSRLDLGKTKYGGPFTTKTFLRILVMSFPIFVTLIACWNILLLGFEAENYIYAKKLNWEELLHLPVSNTTLTRCASMIIIIHFQFQPPVEWLYYNNSRIVSIHKKQSTQLYPANWKCSSI